MHCRLMDSLEIFTKLPVSPEAYYLVGLQVYGVPGFDFLSPIGTSGVTIAAALNPCVGGWAVGWTDPSCRLHSLYTQARSPPAVIIAGVLLQLALTMPIAATMQGTTRLHSWGSRWSLMCPRPSELRWAWAPVCRSWRSPSRGQSTRLSTPIWAFPHHFGPPGMCAHAFEQPACSSPSLASPLKVQIRGWAPTPCASTFARLALAPIIAAAAGRPCRRRATCTSAATSPCQWG